MLEGRDPFSVWKAQPSDSFFGHYLHLTPTAGFTDGEVLADCLEIEDATDLLVEWWVGGWVDG